MLEYMAHLETGFLLFIQDYIRTPVLTSLFVFLTGLGDNGIFWIGVAVLLLCFPKTRKTGFLVVAALIGSLVVNNIILKNIVHRIRPYDAVQGLHCLIERQPDFSFPSGHTGSSFAAAVVLYLELPKRYGVPAVILACLIAFSRLYLGVHYPTDVLGGIITGTLIAVLVRRYLKGKR